MTVNAFKFYDKCRAVIASCKTPEHLEVTKRFIEAGIKRLPRTPFAAEVCFAVRDQYASKRHEIDPMPLPVRVSPAEAQNCYQAWQVANYGPDRYGFGGVGALGRYYFG